MAIPPVPPVPVAWTGPGAKVTPHRAHVTVSPADGPPVEVFVKVGRADTMQGTVNALARVASLALRSGVPAADVIGALRGQADALPAAWWPSGGGSVPSVADALARVLEAHVARQVPAGPAPCPRCAGTGRIVRGAHEGLGCPWCHGSGEADGRP